MSASILAGPQSTNGGKPNQHQNEIPQLVSQPLIHDVVPSFDSGLQHSRDTFCFEPERIFHVN